MPYIHCLYYKQKLTNAVKLSTFEFEVKCKNGQKNCCFELTENTFLSTDHWLITTELEIKMITKDATHQTDEFFFWTFVLQCTFSAHALQHLG